MKKRTAIVTISLLCAVIIAAGAFCGYQARQLWKSRQAEQTYGERALREMSESLNALNEALRESAYATDPVLYSRLTMDAAAASSAALDAMSALPCATHEMEKTVNFINGAGDYAMALSRAASRGSMPDAEALRNVATIETTISTLAGKTVEIYGALSEGAVKMDDYGECSDAGHTDTVGYELRVMESELPEYLSLKYDGQYSAAAEEDVGEGISEDEARRAAALFLGIPEQRLASEGKSNGRLKCWDFSVSKEDDGQEQRIAVTLKDGKVAEWQDTCRPDSGSLTEDEAAAAAQKYLADHGYTEMQEVSRNTQGGVCTFSFVSAQNGVLCMPDAIGVSVSLETGKPCAFVAKDYILHHKDRGELIAKVTPEQAAEKLSDALEPQTSRLVLTQTAGGAELLCHQIACIGGNGENVTVFVNAATGAQEKIMISEVAEA